jgi:hypothetical protein
MYGGMSEFASAREYIQSIHIERKWQMIGAYRSYLAQHLMYHDVNLECSVCNMKRRENQVPNDEADTRTLTDRNYPNSHINNVGTWQHSSAAKEHGSKVTGKQWQDPKSD